MKSGATQFAEWLETRGFSRTEAAKFLRVKVPQVSQWVLERRRPGLRNAAKLEKLTGIPVEAWLTRRNGTSKRQPREPQSASI